MYKIGNTSGLQEKNTDEGKETVKIVGEVVDKMAKKCADVPKKMTTPNKIMEITDGCFSSAQVIEVKDEKSGGAQNAEEAAAEEAAADAAKTSGSCGGGKSSKTPEKEAKSCSKSCCGGKSSSTDQCTGSKLVDTFIPTTIQDMVSAGVQGVMSAVTADQVQFMNSYCAYQPFPECATCPYGRRFRNAAQRNLNSLFRQMRDAMAMLINGYYDTATGMFVCPGLARSLMTGDLGPIAAVAGANAVMSMISLMSVRGALDAYSDLATSAIYTDFRAAVMGSVDTLFRAGSCVGIPGQFVAQVCDILTLIGCSSNKFTRMTTRSGSARSSRFGSGCNLWGKKGSKTKQVTLKPKSPANKTTKTFMNESTETPVDDAIPSVYKSKERQEPSTESIEKSDKAKEKVSKPLAAAKEVTNNPEKKVVLTPTKSTKTYATTTDKVANPEKSYYKKDKTGQYLKVDVEPEKPLDVISAQYGPIYEIEDNGITEPDPEPIVVTDSTVAVVGKIYTYKDPATKTFVEVVTKPGDKIKTIQQKVADKLRVPVDQIVIAVKDDPSPTYQTYKKTTDQKAVAGKTYYKKVDNKYVVVVIPEGTPITEEVYTLEVESGVAYQESIAETPVTGVTYFTIDGNGQFVEIDVSSGSFPVGAQIYERMTIPAGSGVYATTFECSGVCVLNNGLLIEEPVFVDIAAQTMGVDTTAFNTGGRTPAGEMVKMKDLGLSLYEVKMAYLLDHLRNGSIMPVDVEGDEIPTILDTVADND